MREEDSNWFSKWEEQLPPPEELTPLSQTLISRDLALAFDIHPATPNNHFLHRPLNHHFHHRTPNNAAPPPNPNPTSADFDSSSAELGGGGGSDEPARTLKRPRLVWTPQLHKRFVDAVAHLGIKNAVPKTIMQLMSVDGLTRENVASHLQKYRLYLKRMQGGINNDGGGGGGGGGSGDAATDHLFASSPVPAHFLNPQGGGGRANSVHSEHFMGYVQPPPIHHQQQVAAMVAGGQFHHHRQVGQFGSPTGGGHPFLSRQAQMGGVRLGVQNSVSGYVEELDSGAAASGRKVLTLFPSDD